MLFRSKGVGPITVDPEAQAQGVGRRLMEAVLERGQGAVGIRLFQDAFNVQSLSLYASLGFEVKEPAAVISGRLRSGPNRCIQVRPLEEGDLEECETLCLRVHGFERTNELRDALQGPAFSPFVAVRGGRLRAYATTETFSGRMAAPRRNPTRALARRSTPSANYINTKF